MLTSINVGLQCIQNNYKRVHKYPCIQGKIDSITNEIRYRQEWITVCITILLIKYTRYTQLYDMSNLKSTVTII